MVNVYIIFVNIHHSSHNSVVICPMAVWKKDIESTVVMDTNMQDISKLNDVVNAISNNCKVLVKCSDDKTVVLLNQEGGINTEDLSRDAVDAATFTFQNNNKENSQLPRVFTNTFRKDLLDDIYKQSIPLLRKFSDKRAKDDEAYARSMLPGLRTIRRRLRQLLAESNNHSLTESQLTEFLKGIRFCKIN